MSSCFLLYSSLTGKRIAVVSASGYIGSHVDMVPEERCYIHRCPEQLLQSVLVSRNQSYVFHLLMSVIIKDSLNC